MDGIPARQGCSSGKIDDSMSDEVQLDLELPQGRQTLRVEPTADQTLPDLLARQGLPLNTRCGQKGLCDGCVVALLAGRLTRLADGCSVEAADPPVELRACEHRVEPGTAVELRIPARSLLAHKPQIVSQFSINVPYGHVPLAQGVGAAVDIGTTTVAVILVDLADGRIVGEASAFNRQMHLGDNVLTRINMCRMDPAAVGTLQRAVVNETVGPLLEQAAGAAGLGVADIACLSVAGNTTMLHLYAGVDPASMGVVPFEPAFLEHRELVGRAIGAAGLDDVPIHLLPGAAAYVGADLCAGIVSTGLLYDQGPSLLVDIGTNGEIILKYDDHLLGCATAAGPAFEGAGLTCGVRAGDAAIQHVTIRRNPFDLELDIIGNQRTKPIGLCGSAYIDLLGQARKAALLTATGRFDRDAVARAGADGHLAPLEAYGQALRVAWGRGRVPIVITEPDIASLLQAKAAIAAGILTLLRRVGLQPRDVKTLYLAGGFGMHLNLDNTIACGVLPGFTTEQIRLVGNTALAGAYLALLDQSLIAEMAHLSDRMEVIELNQDPSFEDTFIDQLSLPRP